MPTQTVERYLKQGKSADFQIWTTKQRRAWLAPGKRLRIDLDGAATVKWTAGKKTGTKSTHDTGFRTHSAMLPLARLAPSSEVEVVITPKTDSSLKPDAFTVRIRE